MKLESYFGGFLVLFFLFSSVSGQLATPGEAFWVASTEFKVNSTARYATIPQSLVSQEWRNLGTSLTVEFWVYPKAPLSDPAGRWNDNFTVTFNETRYWPLVVRHPGLGNTNQWAHFMSLLVRTTNGLALVVYSGCGCAIEPQIVNGRQADLFNCGFGYVLSSDNTAQILAQAVANNNTSPAAFYFPTEQWTHVAFSFDGDNTDNTKTQTAALYINGKKLITNKWADPANQPTAQYNPYACQNQPMQWFRTFGRMDSITIGYLKNQDFNFGKIVNNLDPAFNFYGFNGAVDELRIWRVPLTTAAIAERYNLALSRRKIESDPTLVAYYNFNQGPSMVNRLGQLISTAGSMAVFPDSKPMQWGPLGMVVTNDPNSQNAFKFWSPSATQQVPSLIINPTVSIAGTLSTTARPIFNRVRLSSYTTAGNNTAIPVLSTVFPSYNVYVQDFSFALVSAIQRGHASVTRASNGAQINPGVLLAPTDEINLVVHCADNFCSNLGGTTAGFPLKNNLFITYTIDTIYNVSANLYIDVYPDCDGAYDACGVCNGDNRTCQCLYYHQFKNVRMSYVLLNFMLDFLIDRVNTTSQILQETLDKVNVQLASNSTNLLSNMRNEIAEMSTFYNGCLNTYCQSITRFLGLIASVQQ